MEYMTTQDASLLWGVTIRRIQAMCDKGKIPGAMRLGQIWVIPRETAKPPDGRTRKAKQAKTDHNGGNPNG